MCIHELLLTKLCAPSTVNSLMPSNAQGQRTVIVLYASHFFILSSWPDVVHFPINACCRIEAMGNSLSLGNLQMLRSCGDSMNNTLNIAKASQVDGETLIISPNFMEIY